MDDEERNTPSAEERAALELVDQIDKHQCVEADRATAQTYGVVEGDRLCRQDGGAWPCWTVRVAHHTYLLGQSQGHIDAAFYAAPDNPGRRLLIMVMTPPLEGPPFPSLNPEEALANPTVPTETADDGPEEPNEEPPAPTRANRPGDIMTGPRGTGMGTHSWSASCERAGCVRYKPDPADRLS